MAHAFIVDYSFFNHDDNMERCPIVAMSDYGYAENGNGHECNFTLVFDWVRTHRCYYQTSEEYQAKVLVRLLNQVSKFYAYREVHDYVNSASSNGLTESDVTKGLLLAKKRLEHMGTREDYRLYGFNTPEQQYLHENIPFHISEIDTNENQDFNPCFFKQEYKFYDENEGPLYVAVVLER